MFKRSTALTLVSTLLLSGCEVDPLDRDVTNPTHRSAFAAAAGVIAPTERLATGQSVQVHQTDGGYRGSGALDDIDNFAPLTFTTCETADCAARDPSALAECQSTGGTTTCVERDDAGSVVGRFSFLADQRFSVDMVQQDRFVSGVWSQTAQQRAQAEDVYARMMQAYQGAYTGNFAQVSDQRNAVMDTLAEIGGAGTPAVTSSAGTPGMAPDTGTETLLRANRQITVRNGYNIGDHPIEAQSRAVAERYTCEAAQRIPTQPSASCDAFRALVIIEACTPEVVPAPDYNADQPQFLRVAAGFANEGADLGAGCGL